MKSDKDYILGYSREKMAEIALQWFLDEIDLEQKLEIIRSHHDKEIERLRAKKRKH